jgi:hypothetical protein
MAQIEHVGSVLHARNALLNESAVVLRNRDRLVGGGVIDHQDLVARP